MIVDQADQHIVIRCQELLKICYGKPVGLVKTRNDNGKCVLLYDIRTLMGVSKIGLKITKIFLISKVLLPKLFQA